jgi:hypothetical protein
MDSMTKMFYVSCLDKMYSGMLSVMLDLKNETVTRETLVIADKIVCLFPELGQANTWLQMVAGTNINSLDKDWMIYLRKEMDREFLEVDEETKSNIEFDKFEAHINDNDPEIKPTWESRFLGLDEEQEWTAKELNLKGGSL